MLCWKVKYKWKKQYLKESNNLQTVGVFYLLTSIMGTSLALLCRFA